MNATTQTINTTADFDDWWRETGQFLQPCDAADPEMREQFRLFASKMYGVEDGYYQEKFEKAAADLVETEEALTEAEKSKEGLVEDLTAILKDATTPQEKVDTIWKLLK